jgi:hypothetical protein
MTLGRSSGTTPYPALDLCRLTADVGPPITYRAVPRDPRPAASPCSYAYAVAEARDEIPSFVPIDPNEVDSEASVPSTSIQDGRGETAA